MRILDKSVKLPVEDLGVLDRCALVEIKCAELYRNFERIHGDVPELAKLWNKTALEEDNHAEQFKFACKLKGTGMVGIKTDRSRISTILQKLETYLDTVKQSNPSPIEALQFAIHLEEVLSEYHMSSVVTFADNELARLFTSMMNNDNAHVNSLQNALSLMLRSNAVSA
jgi:rubrerythrin